MTAAQTQIQDIAFVQLDEMPWNAKTYVKDIKVDYKNYMSAGITSVKNANDEEVTDISKASGKLASLQSPQWFSLWPSVQSPDSLFWTR